ncbi:hypothetical protein M2R47_01715 [Moraxella sp. Tifton1]|uniref:SCP2 domain-containing protein n=1 Tax=Moraxella oculi TaxID=2940516 RepID=A0ABW8U5E0_9GAMM|nr:hypothetical protein [Moraxella sp. Tifton1]MCL1622972.1 hypothetical protein [Moraxella sp. Tifton1]
MFTLPILDVKTDALDALLATVGFRLQSLIKNRNNDTLNDLIDGKNITIQFKSPVAERYYEFRDGRFGHALGSLNDADLTIEFKDSLAGAKLLSKGDIAALMTAIQDGDVNITGDYKLVLWFASVAKHATKIPDEYQSYINTIKPYINQAKPYANQALNAIKAALGK